MFLFGREPLGQRGGDVFRLFRFFCVDYRHQQILKLRE